MLHLGGVCFRLAACFHLECLAATRRPCHCFKEVLVLLRDKGRRQHLRPPEREASVSLCEHRCERVRCEAGVSGVAASLSRYCL